MCYAGTQNAHNPRNLAFLHTRSPRREACKLMKAAYPYGPLIANVARRVLYIIREEYQITMREAANRTADAEADDAKDSEVANNSFDKEGAARVYNPALVCTHTHTHTQTPRCDHPPTPAGLATDGAAEHGAG